MNELTNALKLRRLKPSFKTDCLCFYDSALILEISAELSFLHLSNLKHKKD